MNNNAEIDANKKLQELLISMIKELREFCDSEYVKIWAISQGAADDLGFWASDIDERLEVLAHPHLHGLEPPTPI